MIENTQKEYIFPPDTVMISCHASTVLPRKDGYVVAAWFGGTAEKNSDVEIYVSVRSPEGVWCAPFIVSENDDVAHWNPVLLERLNGDILLFYKRGAEISEWRTHITVSADGGYHWSPPKDLIPGDVSGGRGPVKNKCLRSSSGILIAPASTEKDDIWLPFMDRSADDGITWTKTPLFARPKYLGAGVRLIQPTLWEDKDRVLHCFLRSDKGRLYRSDSLDDGVTWNKPYRTRIPNNNSGVDCCSDMLGRIWLVYNPIGVNWGSRTPLILSVSENNGSHFSPVLTLEEGAGEFSYPSVVCTGNSLHITYTYNRKQIAYYKIQLEAQQRL